jgi:hypothetical protein
MSPGIGVSWLRFSKLARILMRTIRLPDHPIDRVTIGFPDMAEDQPQFRFLNESLITKCQLGLLQSLF